MAAWRKAWIVTILLGVLTGLGLGFAPSCNFHGRCPWYSDLTFFLAGVPATGLSFLVALGMTLYARWRRP
ncbi:hypothetical protein [Roseococcus sp. YIM B11640]|uniref:hypothetical protein n=1 Tax=Roseococcus sp. YIM B11640 TaxID=3133973 RepID=UPI003C7D0384